MNNPSTFPITHTSADGLCLIKGYGTFHKDQIVSAQGHRFVAEVKGSLTFDAPTAVSMGLVSTDVNKPVSVLIRVNTTRHSSEWSTDFIKRGRPIVIELVLNGNDNQEAIATKLETAFDMYNKAFNLSDGLPFTYTRTAEELELVVKAGHLSFQSAVTFMLAGETYGSVVAGTVVASSEATVDGKYLEENVRMSNDLTDGAYTISPDERPIITGSYCTISFKMKATEVDGIAKTWAGHALAGEGVSGTSTDAYMNFILYFNEASTMDTDGPVDDLVDFLITGNDTAIEDFILADGNDAATVAEFIA